MVVKKEQEPQRFTRYVERCDNCGRIGSFRQYRRCARVVYAKCPCGQRAVIQIVVNMRHMKPQT